MRDSDSEKVTEGEPVREGEEPEGEKRPEGPSEEALMERSVRVTDEWKGGDEVDDDDDDDKDGEDKEDEKKRGLGEEEPEAFAEAWVDEVDGEEDDPP